MTTYKLFQIALTDTQVDEVNSKGWGGVSWGRAYMNATSSLDREGAFATAKEAAKLYQRTWTVEADTLEHVFMLTNVGSGGTVLEKTEMAKSGSVGDFAVVLDSQGRVAGGAVCCSFGWEHLSTGQTNELLAAMVL